MKARVTRRNMAQRPTGGTFNTLSASDPEIVGFRPTYFGNGGGAAGTNTVISDPTSPSGSVYLEKRWSVSPSSNSPDIGWRNTAGLEYDLTDTGLAIKPNTTYTISVFIKANRNWGGNHQFIVRSANPGVGFTAESRADFSLTTTWQRISVTHTTRATDTRLRIRTNLQASTGTYPLPGDWAATTGIMVEEVPTLESYFDGNTAGASWTGASNDSASTMPGWLTKPVKVWQSSEWRTVPIKRWNGTTWVTA